MKIADVLQKAETERKIESRFPVRAVFCNSLDEYKELVSKLNGECDICWNLGDFCSDKYPDRYPRFRKLLSKLDESRDKHILLLSVGEYLRMTSRMEVRSDAQAQFYQLWSRMESVNSKTRVFIPMFSAKEYFDRAVGDVDERQKDFLWELDGHDNRSYSITVYSDKFSDTISANNIAHNVKEWLQKWDSLFEKQSPMLVTQQIDNWEQTYDRVSIETVRNPYEFLLSIDQTINNVPQVSSSDVYWADLAVRTSKTRSVNASILEGLNLKSFDSIAIVSQWDFLDPFSQWLVWLWYQINASNEYVAAIVKKLAVTELSSVPQHIANDIIFYMDSHPEWITQRQGLIKSLSVVTPSKEFFAALDDKEPEIALGLLSSRNEEEKAYIIRTICRWLREKETESDIENTVINAVEKVYPEFAAYFRTKLNLYRDYTDYFAWYKRKKIINRQVDKPLPAKNIDFLDTRTSLLAEYNDKDCIAYWIDGLGLEWISLVCSILEKSKGEDYTFTSNMAKCIIPSETMFNEQWNDNTYKSIKRNRLDTISHKGVPDDKDYFIAIASQIRVITEMVGEAIQQLQDHEYVIITGDHGSSRLAALAFHREGTIVPKSGQSMCLGRICLLKNEPSDSEYSPTSSTLVKFKDQQFLVMQNYDHFIQPGNAAGGNTDENAIAGEVHGGMTIEESVVPVIVLKRKKIIIPLTYKISEDKLKTMGGKGTLTINFSKDLHSLVIHPDRGNAETNRQDDGTWIIRFSGLAEGELSFDVIADNKMISPNVKIQVESRGLKTNDMGMGGLP